MISHLFTRGVRIPALLSTTSVSALSAITVAALLGTRPHLAGSPGSWRGDDLAMASLWLLAVVCAAWLTISAFACAVALTSGRHAAARRIAGWAPPAARRMLQAALIGTWALVPTAAHATTPTTRAPLVVSVDRHGRITLAPGAGLSRLPRSNDPPVVRAAQPTTTTVVAPPVAVHSTVVPVPAAAAPRAARREGPNHAGKRYVVRAGDNLWRIAEREVAHHRSQALANDAGVKSGWQNQVIRFSREGGRPGETQKAGGDKIFHSGPTDLP